MNILREVGSELVKMFIGDAWLTIGVLVVVVLTGLIATFGALSTAFAGGFLLLGCIVVLVASIVVHARQQHGR